VSLASDAPAAGTGTGAARRPALSRCTAVPLDDFADQVWGQLASLSRAVDLPRQPAAFSDLFSLDDADHILGQQGLRTPFLRMAKAGNTLPTSAFTSSGGVGAAIADQVDDAKVAAAFAGGATVVLQALHRTHAPLISFARRLGAELGHPVQVNAYITPPQSQGFSDHYDVHDVFVLQVAGRKRWRIHAPVHEHPLRDQPWTDRRKAVEAVAADPCDVDAVLEPGDALYLPRGWIHAATALGGASCHLTVGIHVWTRWHLLEQLVAGLADVEHLREPLPLGVDVTDPGQVGPHLADVVELLREAAPAVSAAGVTTRLSRLARSSARPEVVRPLAQATAAQSASPETRLRWREGLPRAQALPAGVADSEAVSRLRAGEVLSVADVGERAAAALLVACLVVPA
jgi:hypothetical protein